MRIKSLIMIMATTILCILVSTSSYAQCNNTDGPEIVDSNVPALIEGTSGFQHFLQVKIHNSTKQTLLLHLKCLKYGYVSEYFSDTTVLPNNEASLELVQDLSHGPDGVIQIVNSDMGKNILTVRVQQNYAVFDAKINYQILSNTSYKVKFTVEPGSVFKLRSGLLIVDVFDQS